MNEAFIAPDIVNAFRSTMHRTYVYLAGSTTKEAPYEMEYCLHKALAQWVTRKTIITTALTSHHDFHFAPADPWKFVKQYLPGFSTNGYDPLLVQLGLPRLYRHKPVYCIALYHELGHFVDELYGITDLSLVLEPDFIATQHITMPGGASAQSRNRIESYHRKEYFCDIFGAAYGGRASIEALVTIAPGAPPSQTHPSTADREASVDSFLSGRQTPLLDLFQRCLKQQAQPALGHFLRMPDIAKPFDDLRPYKIIDDPELHGMVGAAWTYLLQCLDQRTAPWIVAGMADSEIERIVNDLTEKTLRNASIRERWSSHGTAP